MSVNFFSENVDKWGASEWFNRLADAVRQQDAAIVAGDKIAFEICRNVAASSAMRLVRDYEHEVRAALTRIREMEQALLNSEHYFDAIRARLGQLYNEHPNDPRLREHIGDEVDWLDSLIAALSSKDQEKTNG